MLILLLEESCIFVDHVYTSRSGPRLLWLITIILAIMRMHLQLSYEGPELGLRGA